MNILIRSALCSLLILAAFDAAFADSGHRTAQKCIMPEPYEPIRWIEPPVIYADFDRDGTRDFFGAVVEKSSSRKGIAFCNGGTGAVTIFGAGIAFDNGGDDFSWMDNWQLLEEPLATAKDGSPAPSTGAPRLLVEKKESSSAVIYYDGKDFVWEQRGD